MPARERPVDGLTALSRAWRERAEQLDRFAPAAAVAFRECAAELDAAAQQAAGEVLTIAQAAVASGFSPDHLRHQIAAGTIPNVGRKGRPRVRASDLPRKATRTLSVYDPDADALSLTRRLGG